MRVYPERRVGKDEDLSEDGVPLIPNPIIALPLAILYFPGIVDSIESTAGLVLLAIKKYTNLGLYLIFCRYYPLVFLFIVMVKYNNYGANI